MSSFPEDAFYAFVKEHDMVRKNEKIAVGVSGGADSVCLLFLLKRLSLRLPFDITAVHVNHMIRGKEAQRDEDFVKQLCGELETDCICVRADVPLLAKREKTGLEEAGRMARYKAFEEAAAGLAGSGGAAKIAVAHHKDDNAETFLLNLVRGSDIKGLSGMKPVSRRGGLTIIRPLLFMGRREIEEYLKENSIPYILDSTNFSDDYARNRIRNIIIPELLKINSGAVEHINETALIMDTFSDYYGKSTDTAFKENVTVNEGEARIDISGLASIEPLMQRSVVYNAIGAVSGTLKDIGRIHVSQILALTEKQTGKSISLPYNLQAQRSYGKIIIRKLPETSGAEAAKKSAFVQGKEKISFLPGDIPKGGRLCFELEGGAMISFETVKTDDSNRECFTAKNKYTKAFDYDIIKGALVLGKPESGDKITFPGGTKTVKKYFTDEKIPAGQREKIPVLKDEQGVLWIVGFRIGEKYKITDKTGKALVVSVCGGEYGRED